MPESFENYTQLIGSLIASLVNNQLFIMRDICNHSVIDRYGERIKNLEKLSQELQNLYPEKDLLTATGEQQ